MVPDTTRHLLRRLLQFFVQNTWNVLERAVRNSIHRKLMVIGYRLLYHIITEDETPALIDLLSDEIP